MSEIPSTDPNYNIPVSESQTILNAVAQLPSEKAAAEDGSIARTELPVGHAALIGALINESMPGLASALRNPDAVQGDKVVLEGAAGLWAQEHMPAIPASEVSLNENPSGKSIAHFQAAIVRHNYPMTDSRIRKDITDTTHSADQTSTSTEVIDVVGLGNPVDPSLHFTVRAGERVVNTHQRHSTAVKRWATQLFRFITPASLSKK